MNPGDPVLVWDPEMALSDSPDEPIVGTIHYVNGDSVDVVMPNGDVDCFPFEWCWVKPTP